MNNSNLTIKERAQRIISLDYYNQLNIPLYTGINTSNLFCPHEEQYILRMLVREPLGEFKIPKELYWLSNLLKNVDEYQKNEIKINHPYCYVTVRKGQVKSINDDVWHVDGFSTRISHIPEQNYVYSDCYPTQYLVLPINFSNTKFDPKIHNIHTYIQQISKEQSKIKSLFLKNSLPNRVYCIDPYVIHRRPKILSNVNRTFVRISFTPIPIMDCNNTVNPLIPIIWNRDGVKDFRNKLIRYKK